MRTSGIVLAALLIIVISSANAIGPLAKFSQKVSQSSEDEVLQTAEKYLMTVKGFWTGFVTSIYRDSEMQLNQRCFSKDLLSEIYFLVNFASGQEPMTQAPKFVVTFAKIFNDNFHYCGYVQLA